MPSSFPIAFIKMASLSLVSFAAASCSNIFDETQNNSSEFSSQDIEIDMDIHYDASEQQLMVMPKLKAEGQLISLDNHDQVVVQLLSQTDVVIAQTSFSNANDMVWVLDKPLNLKDKVKVSFERSNHRAGGTEMTIPNWAENIKTIDDFQNANQSDDIRFAFQWMHNSNSPVDYELTTTCGTLSHSTNPDDNFDTSDSSLEISLNTLIYDLNNKYFENAEGECHLLVDIFSNDDQNSQGVISGSAIASAHSYYSRSFNIRNSAELAQDIDFLGEWSSDCENFPDNSEKRMIVVAGADDGNLSMTFKHLAYREVDCSDAEGPFVYNADTVLGTGELFMTDKAGRYNLDFTIQSIGGDTELNNNVVEMYFEINNSGTLNMPKDYYNVEEHLQNTERLDTDIFETDYHK